MLHFAVQVEPIFNFWHSATLALNPERQSARMSEIKNVIDHFYKCNHLMLIHFKGLILT